MSETTQVVTSEASKLAEEISVSEKLELVLEKRNDFEEHERRIDQLNERVNEAIDEIFTDVESSRLAEIQDAQISDDLERVLGEVEIGDGESVDNVIERMLSTDEIKASGLEGKLGKFLRDERVSNYREAQVALGREKKIALGEVLPVWDGLVEDLELKTDYRQMLGELLAVKPEADGVSGGHTFHKVVHRLLNDLSMIGSYKTNGVNPDWNLYFGTFGLVDKIVEIVEVFESYQTEDLTEVVDGQKTEHLDELGEYTHQINDYIERAASYHTLNIDPGARELRTLLWRVSTGEKKGEVIEELASRPRALQALESLVAEKIELARNNGWISRGELELNRKDVGVVQNTDIEVLGLEEEEGFDLVVKEEDFAGFIVDGITRAPVLRLFPSRFIEGISRIEFVDVASNRPGTDDVRNEFDYKFYKDHFREKIIGTLFHEIFENVAQTLSYDEMVRWDRAIDSDSDRVSAVSWYGKYGQANPDQVWSWRKEDFCEAGRLFVVDPLELFKISPARFRTMLEFFAVNLPEEYRKEFKRSHVDWVRKRFFRLSHGARKIYRSVSTQFDQEPTKQLREKEEDTPIAVTTGRLHVERREVKEEDSVPGRTIEIRRVLRVPSLESVQGE